MSSLRTILMETNETMMPTKKCSNATSRWGFPAAVVLVLLFVFSGSAHAQWTPYATPEFEVSGTYSFVRANGSNSSGFNLNGGSGSLTYNFTHWLAVVGDGGWYHFGGLPSDLSSYMVTYAGGPRITFRNHERFIPFVQVLAGGARLSATSGGIHAADNAFLIMPGAGIDLGLHHGFAIRAIQVDYIATRFEGSDGSRATQNNFRISAGIVFRFGDR
jgi:hypothetical protein